MNIGYICARAAQEYSNNICVVEGGKRITFREVNERANRLANALLDGGLKKGDRVAVLMGNSWRVVEVDLGIARAGLVRVSLNARLAIKDHVTMLNETEVQAFIVGPEYVEHAGEMEPQLATVKRIILTQGSHAGWATYEDLLASASPSDPAVDINEDDLYQIQYTSGTTGQPRGAMIHHGAWLSSLYFHLAEMETIRETDALLHVAPMTHSAGVFALPHFVRGARQVVLKKFDPQVVLETIEKEKITFVVLVPTMIYMLLAEPNVKKFDLSSLKTILYAASPMSVEKLKEAIAIFGRVFQQGYGLTECIPPVAHFPKEDHVVDGPPEIVKRLGSCGRPAIGVEVRVIGEDGNQVKPGEVGQIVCRSGNVFKGYLNRPEDTAKTLRDGWLYTRDLATVDEYGYLYIVDRLDDMIISGGFNIFPREVEEVLYAHPSVYEVAVVAVPDEKWGEAVKAVVALKQGASATQQELIDFCEERLTRFKKPKTVDFVDALPKNPNGKILRRALREQYWKGRGRLVH